MGRFTLAPLTAPVATQTTRTTVGQPDRGSQATGGTTGQNKRGLSRGLGSQSNRQAANEL